MNKEFICIVCPRGCHIFVNENKEITGNLCKRGLTYVKTELTNPTRTLTTTVKTVFEDLPRVSVKSDKPIPKKMIFEIMDALADVKIDKPMEIGEIVVKDILDTGANIVLTKSCKK